MDYKRLLEAHRQGAEKRDEIRAEEVADLLEVARRIAELDVDALVRAKRESLTPMERMIEDVEKGIAVKRQPPKKPKVHWKTAKKKARLKRQAKYRKYDIPKRRAEKLDLMKKGAHGWYMLLKLGWIRGKVPVELTEEEFTAVIWPVLEGRVPIVRRYDTDKPISLYNIWVEDVDTRKVIFDGTEWSMNVMGYTVQE